MPQSEFCKAMRARKTDWQALKHRIFEPAQAFAASLYQKVAAKEPGNLAVSPFSIDEKPNHGSPDFARETAWQKIKNRVEGTRLAAEKLGVRTV